MVVVELGEAEEAAWCDGMGWVTSVPVRALLEAPLPPERGGYAAQVFVVSRAEGDGVVHRQHLGDWSSIHDLTGRHVAVITPDPERVAVVDIGVAVRGFALFGDVATRLVDASPWPRPPTYAARLPMPVEEHATAVTVVATELQEYFGIPEDLLPCAVVACTRERQVVVVGLSRRITVYGLLKQVKSRLDPQLARLNQIRAELAAHLPDETDPVSAELAAAQRRAGVWRAAVAARREWVDRRTGLAGELTDLAADVDADTAALCRWFAARLPEDRALAGDEVVRADRLFAVLRSRIGNLSSRRRGSLLRRLRHVVAALGTDVAPVPEKPDDDLADLAERAGRAAARAARDRAGYDDLRAAYAATSALDMLGAVRSAAERLGLAESHSGLLPWREVRWPVTVFTAPPGRAPSVRTDRG